MNNVLVDTNVLVYAIDEDSIFHERSQKLLLDSDHILHTTSKNLSEFLVVLTRNAELKISTNVALDLLGDLISNLKIIYPNEKSFDRFKKLLRKYNPKGLRIHDFEIISIGLVAGIKKIATLNKGDFNAVSEIQLIEF